MDIEFNSVEELYERLKPALKTKCSEMKRYGITYIKEEDIWNYLKEVKWKKAIDLGLYDMVRDVLNTDNEVIDNYLKSKLNLNNRKMYFED
ncbi:MAG: post-transcriptional regulator [Bacilli bacterium]|nr:post-transcriptional regulator [Bacilli bacterium]MDD4808418.1 post-transcriptional regulator [Bacilli bacterium]